MSFATRGIAIGVAMLSAFASTSVSAAPPSASNRPVDDCKPRITANSNSVEIGFARPPSRTRTTGSVVLTPVFVDFPDARAGTPAGSYYDTFVPEAVRALESLSYGRLDIVSTRPSTWLRMPRSTTDYPYRRGMSGADHLDLIRDAIQIADPTTDFTRTDLYLVVMPPQVSNRNFETSAAIMGTPAFGVLADGNFLMNGVTVGTDWPFVRSKVVAHELLHSLGLVDLYDGYGPWTSPADGNRYVGPYSVMGNVSGVASELFAWERWVLSWIDDTQAVCLGREDQELTLESVAVASSRTKIAAIPLGGSRFLALEARTREGLDRSGYEGVLPYVVDPSISTARGPIRVPPSSPPLVVQPFPVGKATVVEGLGVEVLSRQGSAFTIRLYASPPRPTPPGDVLDLRLSSRLGTVTASWQEPLKTGWTAISHYEYRVGTGAWTSAALTQASIKGLRRGSRVTLEVRAVNAAGTGPAKAVSGIVR